MQASLRYQVLAWRRYGGQWHALACMPLHNMHATGMHNNITQYLELLGRLNDNAITSPRSYAAISLLVVWETIMVNY